jgi:hypothetical protein
MAFEWAICLGHGRWQQYPPPTGHVHLTEPAWPAGGVWFSTAAIAQPEGVREPSQSTGSTGPAFRRIRNSRANPACTEPMLPSFLSQFGVQPVQLRIQVLPELLQALTIHTSTTPFALTHSQAISRFFCF